MKNSLLELWNDLRARRLLPVAVLLVAGLVAVPLVLSKSAEEPPAPAAEPAAPAQAQEPQGPEELAKVKLAEGLEDGNGSSLSAFDPSNPFSPPEEVLEAERQEEAGDPGTTGDTGSTGDTSTGTGTGGGTPTGGDTPDTGDGDGGDTKTTEFTYLLDVTFWANGRKRRIERLRKLDMLPSEVRPLLIYMGVTESAGNAVFLVDSTLETTGEGKCKPNRADCAFLYLGAGAEQEFTNDLGASYRLRINEIRKVKVGDLAGATASDSKTNKSAHAAVGAPASARRFAFPVLTDLVVESVEGSDNSTGADERR